MQHNWTPCAQVPQGTSDPPRSESTYAQLSQSTPVPPCSESKLEPRESEASLVKVLKESLAMTRLPAPELFMFTGDPLQFTEWSTCFKALIETSCTDPAHRLSYLKTYISGEALCVLE